MSASALVPDTIPETAHSKYPGASCGDVIGLSNILALEFSFRLPLKEKEFYGDRIVSGGTQDNDATSQCRDDASEPGVYNYMPELFCQSLFVAMSRLAVRPQRGAGRGQGRTYYGEALLQILLH